MIDTLFGWHIQEKLKGKFITITFEESIEANGADTLSLGDAEDGSTLQNVLDTDNFILTDVFCRADPGFIKAVVLPDNDPLLKFRIEATNIPTRIPIMPPKLVQVDLVIDYENEGQPNDLYVSFTAMRIPQNKMDDLTMLSEVLPVGIQNIDFQTLGILKELQNLVSLQQGLPAPWTVTIPKAEVPERKAFCKRS